MRWATVRRGLLAIVGLSLVGSFAYFVWPTPWAERPLTDSRWLGLREHRFTGRVEVLTLPGGWIGYRTERSRDDRFREEEDLWLTRAIEARTPLAAVYCMEEYRDASRRARAEFASKRRRETGGSEAEQWAAFTEADAYGHMSMGDLWDLVAATLPAERGYRWASERAESERRTYAEIIRNMAGRQPPSESETPAPK